MTARFLLIATVLAVFAAACGGSSTPSPSPADGIDGAPVPPLQALSSDFDEDRFRAAGGVFPPLNDPVHVLPHEATWLSPDSLVLGAVQNGEARAYPISMMTFHHVSNDILGGEPYLVTF